MENKKQTDRQTFPFVSVVITTKNEEKNIENCIRSIQAQTYPKDCLEIIVVDNNSRDRTKQIARNYTPLVFDKGPERSAQRNYGIMAAGKGDYALYLDADMILSPCLLKRCVETAERENSIALYIPEIILGTSYWSQVRRFERSFYDGTVIDVVRFLRKSACVNVGGFDESLSGPEDWDFDKKLRASGKIGLVDGSPVHGGDMGRWEQEDFLRGLGVDPSKYGGVIYHNESEFNMGDYLNKKSYYSKDMDKYITKWGRQDPDIQKQLGLGYRFFGVFVENGKWKKMIVKPHLLMGMYLLRFLVGLRFLRRQSNQQ